MNLDDALHLTAVVLGSLLVLSLWRRREAVAIAIRAFAIYLAVVFGVKWALEQQQPPMAEIQQLVISVLGGICAALVWFIRYPARGRRLPARHRRAVIERHERQTGEKFDSRTHEIHHKIPFSRGGTHGADNLKVVEKSWNRSRGDRPPWWDVLNWFS